MAESEKSNTKWVWILTVLGSVGSVLVLDRIHLVDNLDTRTNSLESKMELLLTTDGEIRPSLKVERLEEKIDTVSESYSRRVGNLEQFHLEHAEFKGAQEVVNDNVQKDLNILMGHKPKTP